MITSEIRKELRKAFGHPFTSKGVVKDVMGYSQYNDVRKYFYGLPRIGQKFFTDDVIERILGEIEYEE